MYSDPQCFIPFIHSRIDLNSLPPLIWTNSLHSLALARRRSLTIRTSGLTPFIITIPNFAHSFMTIIPSFIQCNNSRIPSSNSIPGAFTPFLHTIIPCNYSRICSLQSYIHQIIANLYTFIAIAIYSSDSIVHIC